MSQSTITSRQRSLEQKRTQAAWASVAEVKGKAWQKDYRQLALSAPALIQTNGLGQALAFWRVKSKGENGKGFDQLYKDVAEWTGKSVKNDKKDLLLWIIEDAPVSEYRRATTEAIAFLSWVKRFAEAELQEPQQQQEGSNAVSNP
jgi:CRISPR-associated protein Cmr5